MTRNQIAFAQLRESIKHNREVEEQGRATVGETRRSNLAREAETKRSNLINERELTRSHRANEIELERSHLAQEANQRYANETLRDHYTTSDQFVGMANLAKAQASYAEEERNKALAEQARANTDSIKSHQRIEEGKYAYDYAPATLLRETVSDAINDAFSIFRVRRTK